MKNLLRLYSCAFHALFAFVAAGMAVISLLSGPQTLNFYLLPWTGRTLIYGLSALAVIGVSILLLALRGKAQMLFLGWSLVLLALIVRYFFFSQFAFTPDTGDFKVALWLMLAAILAVVGAGVKPARDYR
jgi:hypothetical protein